jgi:hypothetical protein
MQPPFDDDFVPPENSHDSYLAGGFAPLIVLHIHSNSRKQDANRSLTLYKLLAGLLLGQLEF